MTTATRAYYVMNSPKSAISDSLLFFDVLESAQREIKSRGSLLLFDQNSTKIVT